MEVVPVFAQKVPIEKMMCDHDVIRVWSFLSVCLACWVLFLAFYVFLVQAYTYFIFYIFETQQTCTQQGILRPLNVALELPESSLRSFPFLALGLGTQAMSESSRLG
jgi:hypothetical protein